MAVAADADGTVAVTGYFYSSLDLGGGVLSNSGGEDIFLGVFAANGTHLWSKQFGGGISYGSIPGELAFDGQGNLLLGGTIFSSVNMGGGYLPGNGTYSAVVAKYQVAGGEHVWSRNSQEISTDRGYAVAADPSGRVIFSGTFNQAIDWGGAVFSAAGMNDAFLVQFTP